MALVNNGDGSSYLPPGDSPGRNTEQPQSSSSKTTPFSISAILSEEVGRKRPLMSTTAEVKEKRPRLSEAGHGTEEEGCVSPVGSGGPSISLSHAGSLVLSPQQTSPPGLQGTVCYTVLAGVYLRIHGFIHSRPLSPCFHGPWLCGSCLHSSPCPPCLYPPRLH